MLEVIKTLTDFKIILKGFNLMKILNNSSIHAP